MLCGIGIVTFISGRNHYSNLFKKMPKKKKKLGTKELKSHFSPSIIFTFKQDTHSGALTEV